MSGINEDPNNAPHLDQSEIDIEAEKPKADSAEDDKGAIGPEEATSKAEPEVDDNIFRFSFTVKNLYDLDGKVYSPEHEYGDYRWRLLLFPKGNSSNASQQSQSESLSLYLDCRGPVQSDKDDHAFAPPVLWSRSASFRLFLKDQQTNNMDHYQDSSHKFNEKACDWGFPEFAPLSLLEDPKHKFLVDNTVVFEVEITLQGDQYDSRKHTGFAGLKNQGATCYMNSLLQTLYTIGMFRQAVYEMPLPEDTNSNNIPYALQKVFHDLQKGQGVVKTKKLTESFGWDTADAFTQHDVQELNRLLSGHLEEAMQKAKKRNYVAELFEGRLRNYIKCVNVDYESSREETFFDISLNVKGCRDIYHSMDKYVEMETLDGDNKYRADGYEELQEAKRGVKITKLPPVLQLHLKRFDFDFYSEVMVKINDRFEFATEIDLSRYVENSNGDDVYVLHSVLVHSGDVHGGHYYAFIRPDLEKRKWYKFDDEIVTEAKLHESVDDNFGVGSEAYDREDGVGGGGGMNRRSPPRNTRRELGLNARKCSNAYWLQYLRRDKLSKLLKPVRDDDIPPELERRMNAEKQDKEQRRRERAEQHLYMNVAVVTKKQLCKHGGADLGAWDNASRLRVKRTIKLDELKEKLQKANVIDDSDYVRLWKMSLGQNKMLRPAQLLVDPTDDRPLINFDDSVIFKSVNLPRYADPPADAPLRLYAEITEKPPSEDADMDSILLFVKQYTPLPVPSLRFVGHKVVSRGSCLADLEPSLLEWSGLKLEEVLFFEEWSAENVQPINARTPFQYGDLEGGGTIVFQRIESTLSPNAAAKKSTAMRGEGDLPSPATGADSCAEETDDQMDGELESENQLKSEEMRMANVDTDDEIVANDGALRQGPLGGRPMPTAVDYYDYLRNRVDVKFLSCTAAPTDPGVTLDFKKSDSYAAVRKRLALALGDDADSNRIRLYDSPGGSPFRIDDHHNLDAMLRHANYPKMYTMPDSRTLYYEQTDYHIREFEDKDEVRVVWRPDGGATISGSTMEGGEAEETSAKPVGSTVSVLVPPEKVATYQHVISALYDRLALDKDEVSIRLLEVRNNLIHRRLDPNDALAYDYRRLMISSSVFELRAEPVRPEEVSNDESNPTILVQVVHIPPKHRHARVYRYNYFGSPFLLPVAQHGEPVGELRERIRQRVRVSEEDMVSWGLLELSNTVVNALDAADEIWKPCVGDEILALALEHRNLNASKKVNAGLPRDRPLTIHR